MWKILLAVVIAALGIVAGVAIAQQTPNQSTPKSESSEGGSKQAEVPQVPHPNQLMILIRSTLLAVNQANITGNYSVLRELGTVGFQASNNTARLADVFKGLRDQNLDLGPIAILDAKLSRQPSVNANGQLRLTGFFPSRPEQVNFDLAYYYRNGRWLLDGIAVNTSRSQAAAPQPKAPTTSNGKPPAATTAATEPPAPIKPKTASPPPQQSSAAPKTLPNVKDRVETLEVSPPPAKAKKPEPKGQSWYPFQ